MLKVITLLILSINITLADDNCLFFKFCGGGSSLEAKSIPSSATAGSLNPGNLSNVKGFGVETLYQSGNPINFSFVSGNGKIGALVSPTLENSFFGNRSIEIDDLNYNRQIAKKQFKNSKLSFAVGAKIIDNKFLGINLGLSLKRNPDIKNINPGIGLSGRISFFHFGVYYYQDDVKIELGNYINPYSNLLYSSIYNNSTYQEKFSVETYTVGTSINNFSFDLGIMNTKYKFYTDSTKIYLYSMAYSYKKLIFNYALRKEYSQNLAFINNTMTIMRKKDQAYLGVQYLMSQHISLGLQINNFLLNEGSGTLTIYF